MKANHRAGALAASMVSVLLVAGLTGCSGGSDTSRSSSDQSGTTVIKFGINVANPEKQEPATYAIVQAFNEASIRSNFKRQTLSRTVRTSSYMLQTVRFRRSSGWMVLKFKSLQTQVCFWT